MSKSPPSRLWGSSSSVPRSFASFGGYLRNLLSGRIPTCPWKQWLLLVPRCRRGRGVHSPEGRRRRPDRRACQPGTRHEHRQNRLRPRTALHLLPCGPLMPGSSRCSSSASSFWAVCTDSTASSHRDRTHLFGNILRNANWRRHQRIRLQAIRPACDRGQVSPNDIPNNDSNAQDDLRIGFGVTYHPSSISKGH